MKKHEINVDDLLDWVSEQKILYASDSGRKKSLYVKLNGVYIVEHNGKVVSMGSQPAVAVEVYNDL